MHWASRSVPWIGALGLTAISALFAASLYLGCVLGRMWPAKSFPNERRVYLGSILFSAAAWVVAGACESCWWRLHADDASHYGFFFGYRAANLATGVSPLTPMLPLLSAIFLWSIFEIWRLRFADQIRPRINAQGHFPGQATEALIAGSVNRYLLQGNYIAVFMLVFITWLLSLHPMHPFELFEKYEFGVLYELLFCVVVALMLSSGLRLAQTWEQLRILLRELERSPIRQAFSRLKGAGWSPIWQSGGQEEEITGLVRSFEVMQDIKRDGCGDAGLNNIELALKKRSTIRKVLWSDPEESVSGFRNLLELVSELQGLLASVLNDLMNILQVHWETHGSELDESDGSGKEDKLVVVNCCKEEPDLELKKLHRLEEYVALRYVAFIRTVLGNVRRWLILQAVVFSLVLISLNVYSFEPHQSLVWSFTAIFAVIGIIAIRVLIQAHRNQIISRVSGTKPNELGLGFYVRVISLGAAPLVTLLATHFPAIGKLFWSIFQPGLEALK
jgi:hypothetical protein